MLAVFWLRFGAVCRRVVCCVGWVAGVGLGAVWGWRRLAWGRELRCGLGVWGLARLDAAGAISVVIDVLRFGVLRKPE